MRVGLSPCHFSPFSDGEYENIDLSFGARGQSVDVLGLPRVALRRLNVLRELLLPAASRRGRMQQMQADQTRRFR